MLNYLIIVISESRLLDMMRKLNIPPPPSRGIGPDIPAKLFSGVNVGEEADAISGIFQSYFIELFGDFQLHCITSISPDAKATSIFLAENFVEFQEKEDRKFVNLFLKTQVFRLFEDKKLREIDRDKTAERKKIHSPHKHQKEKKEKKEKKSKKKKRSMHQDVISSSSSPPLQPQIQQPQPLSSSSSLEQIENNNNNNNICQSSSPNISTTAPLPPLPPSPIIPVSSPQKPQNNSGTTSGNALSSSMTPVIQHIPLSPLSSYCQPVSETEQ